MRTIFFNEIDFDKQEVRLIKLNPVAITGIREKYIRPAKSHNMNCTVIEYNGREKLVIESFTDVIRAIAFEDANNYWNDDAKYGMPQKLQVFHTHFKYISDMEPEVIERWDVSTQSQSEYADSHTYTLPCGEFRFSLISLEFFFEE